MPCPSTLAEILIQMIQTSLFRIRTLGWSDEAEGCAIEADHVHNLPSLLADYMDEKLTYYWTIERTDYLNRMDGSAIEGWQPLWDRLRAHLAPLNESVTSL